jgi:AcrR family transcriptional regulator
LNARSKSKRADARRSEILLSATRAIREHGLRGAGMREIARAAGLSTGNLYYYFRNKQELVYYCQNHTLDTLLLVAREAAAFPEPRSRLIALIDGHLREVLAGGAALHLDLDGVPPAFYRKLVLKRDRYERAVREILADGHKRRQLREGDPKMQAFVLLGALNWAARWYRPEGSFSVDAIVTGFTEQLLRGLEWSRG